MRYRIMFAAGLGGLLLATGGCLGSCSPNDGNPAAWPAGRQRPSPTGTGGGGGAEGAAWPTQRLRVASGSELDRRPDRHGDAGVDLAGKRYEATVTTTGGTGAGTYHHIVIGADGYQREDADKQWVHLDLSRTKPDSIMVPFTMTDPTGLETFTGEVGSVKRTGPHEFSGRFNPGKTSKRFLPIGVPSVVAFFNTAPFTATTDDQDRVTTIRIELSLTDKPKAVMTTTFSAHGTQPATKAPAKQSVVEADDLYYR